jgi:hypothetical protein
MRRSFVALVALALVACSKKPEDAGGGGAEAAADERSRVQQRCEGMNDLGLLYVAGLLDLPIESLEPPGARAQIVAACKDLSLEVVECADRLDLDSPACTKALEKQMGMTDATPKEAGPAPRWAVETPFEIYDLDVSPEGHVAFAGEGGAGLVVDGAVKWTVELEEASARVAWSGDCVLTGTRGELRCYDDAGAVRWSTAVATGDDDWLSALEADPEGRVTVVTSTGAIVRVDPTACAASAKGCTTAVGTVEALAGTSFEHLPGGAMLGSNDAGVVLVSATGTLLGQRPAELAAGVPAGGLVVVAHEVLRANPACKPGGDDCLTVVLSNAELELDAPVEIPGVGIAHGDRFGVIHMVGDVKWKVDAGNDGDLVSDGTTIYSIGHQLGLGDALEAPPQLRAIDARTGQTQWITPLGRERAQLLSGYIIALRGGSVVVATRSQLFSVPVGRG